MSGQVEERLEEIAMGEAAKAAVTGGLSDDEGHLVCWPGVPAQPVVDRLDRETFLYQHLATAVAAEQAMDRMRSWSTDYHYEYVRRERAIDAARAHYHALRDSGAEIPEHLAELALSQGIR